MSEKIHPAVKGFKQEMEKGKMTRREFVRMSTLLGVSAFAATNMAGLTFAKKVLASPIKKGASSGLPHRSRRSPIRHSFHGFQEQTCCVRCASI